MLGVECARAERLVGVLPRFFSPVFFTAWPLCSCSLPASSSLPLALAFLRPLTLLLPSRSAWASSFGFARAVLCPSPMLPAKRPASTKSGKYIFSNQQAASAIAVAPKRKTRSK